MPTPGQSFYSTDPTTQPYTRADVLAGRVIRLSPALITITDGRVGRESPDTLQRETLARVADLLAAGVRSLHVDVNYPDYGGFGDSGPDVNTAIFTPEFVAALVVRAAQDDAFVTLHLLTADPAARLRDYAGIALGAVCIQLDAVPDPVRLGDLVAQIVESGACASPVIETTGTDALDPAPPDSVRAQLAPLYPQIGMLTLQAAATGTRSNLPAGVFAGDRVRRYLDALRPGFAGTVQLQGGITTATIPAAVQTGAAFLVAGTQILRNRDGLPPGDVIAQMHRAAAGALGV